MPTLVQSVADKRALAALIYSFATTNGWTGVYDNSASSGQVAISNGACEVAIGEITGENSNTTDVLGNPVFLDRLYLALSTGLDSMLDNFIGQPGLNNDSDNRIFIHDLAGTTTAYLFTDSPSTYIHVFVQSENGLRWQCMSFGLLNKNGLTHPDVAYASINRYGFWQTDTPDNSSEQMNRPTNGAHRWIGEPDNYHIRVQPGTLDSSIGFLDTDQILTRDSSGGNTNNGQFLNNNLQTIDDIRANVVSDARSGINTMYMRTANQQLTGGAPMWSIPLILRLNSNGFQTYLGEIPDMRCIDARGFGPAEQFQQGADNWQAFPFCQAGEDVNTGVGSAPLKVTNSSFFGNAVKVIP